MIAEVLYSLEFLRRLSGKLSDSLTEKRFSLSRALFVPILFFPHTEISFWLHTSCKAKVKVVMKIKSRMICTLYCHWRFYQLISDGDYLMEFWELCKKLRKRFFMLIFLSLSHERDLSLSYALIILGREKQLLDNKRIRSIITKSINKFNVVS